MRAQGKDKRDRLEYDQSDRKICGRVRGDNNLHSLLHTETSEHLCGLKVQPAKGKSPWGPKPENFAQPNKSSSIFQKIKQNSIQMEINDGRSKSMKENNQLPGEEFQVILCSYSVFKDAECDSLFLNCGLSPVMSFLRAY